MRLVRAESVFKAVCTSTTASILMLAGTVGAADDSLRISVSSNRSELLPDEILTASISVDNPGAARTVDFYFGAVFPDEDSVVFFTDLEFGFGRGSLSNLARLKPIVEGVALSNPFMVVDPGFFSYRWSGAEPQGTYVLFLAATIPGAFEDGSIDLGDIQSLSTSTFHFTPLATPQYQTYRPLMARVSATGPVFATGSENVPALALERAGLYLAIMLRRRIDVGANLRTEGALTAVFARTETVCDLDYFSDLAGTPICHEAAGGLGGVRGRPATGCSEKNVLEQADDPFGRGTRADGENVCVHELAHTVMNVGLTSEERSRIRSRFDAARSEGLWSGDFAMENADEFFAEMSQSYFCANPDIPAFLHTRGINCAGELRSYDPATYVLIDDIYRGPADLR